MRIFGFSGDFLIPFNYLALLIVFGFLAVFDLLDAKKINIVFILIGAGVLLFMSDFALNSGIMLTIGAISIIPLLFMRFLGIGDKIILAFSFLIYPFYWIWAILIFAILLSKPALKTKSWFYRHFNKNKNVSVAFYPYLFLSTLIIAIILYII